MLPTIIYRSQTGCTYEEREEALTESIESAASNVYDQMRAIENYFTNPSKDIIALQEDIRNTHKGLNECYKILYSAIEGKQITEYKKK